MFVRKSEERKLEHLFEKCLPLCFDVRVWILYIKWCRQKARTMQPTDADPFRARNHVLRAYQRAVDQVGLDISSYPIWFEYVKLVKELGNTPNVVDQSQFMEMARKIYARALQHPMHGLDVLWKDYEVWEYSLNKLTVSSSSKFYF